MANNDFIRKLFILDEQSDFDKQMEQEIFEETKHKKFSTWFNETATVTAQQWNNVPLHWNKNTTFTFTLPAQPVSAVEQKKEIEDDVKSVEFDLD